MSATRIDNVLAVLLIPMRLVGFVIGCLLMVLGLFPVLGICIPVLLVAELLWLLAPFVGIASPDTGHAMAGAMEPALEVFDAVVEVAWAPAAWVIELALG